MSILLKDDKLAYVIENSIGNIAQYISIDPQGKIKHTKINNYKNEAFSLREIIEKLIMEANSKAVNIRSFSPEIMKGNKLVYNKGIDQLDEILEEINKNCLEGKHSIVNENIDINDGGISGVMLGNIIEFSPKDTPKCVEKEGVCLLEKDMGYYILKKIYGFEPELNFESSYRVEFSIHPKKEGVSRTHTLIWEYEKFDKIEHKYQIKWPNNFSRFIGDKVFGLLIADYLGLNVPFTIAIPREVAPFSFGKKTGLFEKWIRTCPVEKEPGKYYTGDKWQDPYALMNLEEAKGNKPINIATILSQDAVEAKFSGGAIIRQKEDLDVVEGVFGKGDDFMVGNINKNTLPNYVKELLKKTINQFRKSHSVLGDVSIEWVFDGKDIWIVQLNQLKNFGSGDIIVNGEPETYEKFFVEDGLESLRSLVVSIEGKNIGIELVGNVGITSHFGDILRQANIPSRIIIN